VYLQKLPDTSPQLIQLKAVLNLNTREEIANNSDSLSPGRYIGTEEVESENAEDFATRMQTLTAQLSEQLEESHRLEVLISKQLKGLGYDI
jgi:type I restriction enzyme M protein